MRASRTIGWALLAILCAVASLSAAVTVAETRHTVVKKIKFSWTSDGSGDATGATSFAYDGKVELLTTDPTDAPTDNYDITITDSDGVDVLAGAGANRDTTNTEQVLGTSLGAVAGSVLTITVANAGATKSGVAYLYVR